MRSKVLVPDNLVTLLIRLDRFQVFFPEMTFPLPPVSALRDSLAKILVSDYFGVRLGTPYLHFLDPFKQKVLRRRRPLTVSF